MQEIREVARAFERLRIQGIQRSELAEADHNRLPRQRSRVLAHGWKQVRELAREELDDLV